MISQEALHKQLVDVFDRIKKDAAVLSSEVFLDRPNETSRSVADMFAELTLINHRIATRFSGGDPGPFPDGWVKATDGEDYDTIVAALDASLVKLLESAGEDWSRSVKIGEGEQSVAQMMNFVAMHTVYHDGQVNYIQTLHGDAANHW